MAKSTAYYASQYALRECALNKNGKIESFNYIQEIENVNWLITCKVFLKEMYKLLQKIMKVNAKIVLS